jgi:ABC-type nickel/cobalt efflux system permease component RcnA
MRKPLLILGLLIGAVAVLFWATGGLAALEHAATAAQREVQNALATALRALKTGQPGAVAGLLALAFGYGFFHAAGPGHGKMLIGAYGIGSRVRIGPLAAIAIASSLAQATVAVALVYAGILILGWTREQLVGVGEDVMTPISFAAVATLGLWLAWRGLRGLRAASGPARAAAPASGAAAQHDAAHGRHDHTTPHDQAQGHRHDHAHHDHAHHDHAHGHDAHPHHAHSDHADHDHVHDAHCGHAHGPSLDQIARVRGWRDAAALIAGIAIRPCTGAIFVLILTWQMGIAATGILAAYVMGLGTASVTLAVAALSVWAREGALAALPGQGLARALPALELAAGALIAIVSTQLLIAAL